ncbi:unnamed protein product [marine sediment metagenome]|uniref:Peptidase S54 rhomboid domain-containing protein n=1 Tax=marine sediment metagenome TaxID=412755 RepID=X1L4Q4_9ZZZZ
MIILPIGDINPRKTVPYVNYTIIGLNIIIFFLFSFRSDYQQLVLNYGLVPARLEITDFIASMFLHGSVWHLLGNMLYLWICGDNVEDRLGHFGYIVLYVGAGIAAGLVHSMMVSAMASEIPCIGASGAIAGVLGAYVIIFPKSKIKFFYLFWLYIFIRMGVFHLVSMWAIGFWFVQQLFLTYLASAYQMPSSIAYWAHIGGFIIGAISIGLLRLSGIVRGGISRWEA